MKYVFVTRESVRDAGARTRCYYFADYLKACGLDTSVFSFADTLGAKSGKGDAEFILREKMIYMYRGYRLFSRMSPETVFIVNRFNYHTLPIWAAARRKGMSIIFDIDDWEARENIKCCAGFPRSKAEYLMRLLVRRSVFCIGASRYLVDYLRQYNDRVYYIPTGVDTEVFIPTPDRSRPDFVFSWHGSVNRIECVRYLRFLIECFILVRQKHPHIKLYLRGDGIFGAQLRNLAALYADRGVTYYGWVASWEIPSYLDNIDAGLIPLLDSTRFNRAKSPVKLFEYMAKAKPVVASGNGEAAYVIHDGSNGFLAANQDEFVQKMEMLVADRARGAMLGLQARKTVEEKYALRSLGKQLQSLLESVYA